MSSPQDLKHARIDLERQDSIRHLITQTTPTRDSIIGKISQNYDVDPKSAASLLSFHRKIRALTNDLFGTTSLKDSFEGKRQGFSRFAKMADEMADVIPFGSIARPFTFLARLISGKIEENNDNKIYTSFEILNPTHDPIISAQIAKELASRITEEHIDEISAIKNKEQAEAMAIKYFGEVLETLLNNKEELEEIQDGIDNGKNAASDLTLFIAQNSTERPTSSPKNISAVQPFPLEIHENLH